MSRAGTHREPGSNEATGRGIPRAGLLTWLRASILHQSTHASGGHTDTKTLGPQYALGVRKHRSRGASQNAAHTARCSRAAARDMAQHSILAGVDGSEASKDAVLWAVGTMRDGDTLCLITVSTCLARWGASCRAACGDSVVLIICHAHVRTSYGTARRHNAKQILGLTRAVCSQSGGAQTRWHSPCLHIRLHRSERFGVIAIILTHGCVAGRCWAGCYSACAGGPGHDAGGRACSWGALFSRPCGSGLMHT